MSSEMSMNQPHRPLPLLLYFKSQAYKSIYPTLTHLVLIHELERRERLHATPGFPALVVTERSQTRSGEPQQHLLRLLPIQGVHRGRRRRIIILIRPRFARCFNVVEKPHDAA